MTSPAFDDYLSPGQGEELIKRGLAKNAVKYLSDSYKDRLANHPLLEQMMN